MKPTVKTIADQPSWVIRSDEVELAVTRLGGQMAPVSFYRRSRAPVRPYYISPWQGEGLKIDDPVLVPLRGDFFCLPFGAPSEFRGRRHDCHGESATRQWTCEGVERSGGMTTLTLSMSDRTLGGRVLKMLGLVDGQNVVYCRHVLEGFSGRAPLAHHATLAMPTRQRSVHVATSPKRFCATFPMPGGDPADGEYSCLAPNNRFKSLSRVPTIWREPAFADCATHPARKGFVDIVACVNSRSRTPAWTAATFADAGFVWFSLKDAAVLPTTMLWMENHGRHSAPWNGRNCCLGLEDICAFFSLGMAASVRPNALSRAGVPTAVRFDPRKATVVNYIQGVVKVPRGFGKVRTVRFAPGKATFVSTTRKSVTAPVNHEFLRS
ncbi:MAG TPA: hypothetical protein VNA25_22995 [Phycisphaerae bacterium]|nr:hypothetical protein [Phycisphaerae bacterium]HUT60723.1 hypothetical protein [Phycisphaerae bacterium]